MRCEKIRSAIYAYLDKALTRQQARVILGHLTECPECFGAHEYLRLLKFAILTLYRKQHVSQNFKKKVLNSFADPS